MRSLLIAGLMALTLVTGSMAEAPSPSETRRPPTQPAIQHESPAPDGAPAIIDAGPIAESDFDHSACLLALYLAGASYEEIEPIEEDMERGCGILRPIRVSQILPGLSLTGEPVMRCETARQLAFWLRDFVIPAARMLPEKKRLTSLQPGSTYQCRDRIGDDSTALSEHALGNAFDLMSLGFLDGTQLPIQPRDGDGDLIEAFQRSIRASACLYFTTVLGPGTNAAHDDHLHLDIKARKGSFRLCQ